MDARAWMQSVGVTEMLMTGNESKHLGLMKMILDILKSHHVSGTVLSACHASSCVILKTAPKGIIITILEMRKLWFLAK